MKILIVSEQWPWPLDSGGKVAQFGWIDYLRHHYKITLIVPIFGNGPVLVPLAGCASDRGIACTCFRLEGDIKGCHKEGSVL
jgi:hypothetical protein